MNTFEANTLLEVQGKVERGERVSDWEKQLVLNVLKRSNTPIPKYLLDAAKKQGFE